MQQCAEKPSCSCIGSLFAPQETWFLARQQPTLYDSPARTRNRSSELLLHTEGKPAKRSLRKRPASNSHLPGEMVLPLGFFENGGSGEMRVDFHADSPHPYNQYSFSIIEDLPPSTARHSHLQASPTVCDRPPAPNIDSHPLPPVGTILIPTQEGGGRGSPQRCYPQSLPFLCHPVETGLNHFQQIGTVGRQGSHLSNTAQQGSPGLHEHDPVMKVHFPIKCEQQETQSWIPVAREEVLIEDFDRLFRREEHQSQANLAEYRGGKAREAKRSKRLQKQLVGRLAQSDDDACSESAPSQVIGKGFDNSHFQHAFWESEDGQQFEETLATRSTNTKVSQWQKGGHRLPDHPFRSDSHI